MVYRFLQDSVAQLSDPKDRLFLKHIDDKGDRLMVDEDLNITGIIDWQMARIVRRREAFAAPLVSADMKALCEGDVSPSENDVALNNVLHEKRPGLADHMKNEKVRRFFWGLGLRVAIGKCLLQVFEIEHGWDEWKEVALKRHESDERLKSLVEEPPGNKC